MYLSILGGAVWGITRAIPLACTVRVPCGQFIIIWLMKRSKVCGYRRDAVLSYKCGTWSCAASHAQMERAP